ncbi:MAG: hypothetical protein FJW31_10885 [Acidobacteria bacterium]|nr:hypothetical protein [Acidobacteriota bacterium]
MGAWTALAQAPRCDAERQLLAARFAGQSLEMTRMPGPCAVRGDFDGDGRADVAVLVRLKAAAPDDNPWAGKQGQGAKGSLALAVPTETRAALLSHPDFFASPIWLSLQGPLFELTPRGKGPKAAKHAAVSVATESGDEMWLYWTGSAWRIGYPQSSSSGL